MAVAERPDTEQVDDTRERVVVWDTGEVLYVHPVASLFPMMSDEELDDLAEDIKANGLLHPIILDQHRQIVDGRNRLEACRRAEISPDFVVTPLEDPVALILSANVERRQLNKGQQAMARVMARWGVTSEYAKGQRPHLSPELAADLSLRAIASEAGLSREWVRRAAVVLRSSTERAHAVLSGATLLEDAFAKVQEEKRLAESDEQKLARLKDEAPELAYMVAEGRLTLAGALAEVEERHRQDQERERQELAHRQATTKLIAGAVVALDPGHWTSLERAKVLWEAFDPELLPEGEVLTVERLRACAAVLEKLIARAEDASHDEQ